MAHASVASLLAQATGMNVTDKDYDNWLEIENAAAYKRFDRAAKKFLGLKLYAVAEQAARLDLVLCVKLGAKINIPAYERSYARRIIKTFA